MSKNTMNAIMYGVIIVLIIGIVVSASMLLTRPEVVVEDESESEEVVREGYFQSSSGQIPDETEGMSEESNVQSEPVDRVVITGDNINVRSGPSTESDRLGSCYNGYDFEYLGTEDDEWFKIKYNGEIGYIFSDYGVIKKMCLEADGSYSLYEE